MKPLALVTGATSGIGAAYADRLAADGYDLIIVGRREDRLSAFVDSHKDVEVFPVASDLTTSDGIGEVATILAEDPVTMLVNCAGVSHYGELATLDQDKMIDVIGTKILAPTSLTQVALPGMIERGEGTIVNISGMFAFSGPAPATLMPRRAVYGASLSYLVTQTQLLSSELEGTGVRMQVVVPGIVATEFHSVQGLDLSHLDRMSAHDVVHAGMKGLELGEVVTAPGVEDVSLLDGIFAAEDKAWAGQSTKLASRYLA